MVRSPRQRYSQAREAAFSGLFNLSALRPAPFEALSRLWLGSILMLYLGADPALAVSGKNLLQNFLKPAIVKLNVRFPKSLNENDVEHCEAEGTGFIIDSRHIVTAAHVFDF